MKCNNCNIEVKYGTKFCHNCGTPIGEVHDAQVQHNDVKKTIVNSLEQETTKNKTLTNRDATISMKEKKKANRIGKIAMWSTIAAIIMSFVVTGFGFSFKWYFFIIFMAFLVFVLSITIGGSIKSMNDGDVFLAKAVSVVCFVCIALLWKCGPLNSDYSNERDDVNVSVNTDDYIPSWIEGKWGAVLHGGETIIILNNGSAHMEIVENKSVITTETIVSYDGSYYIRGNYVYLSLNGMSIVLEIDEKRQLLYGKGGGIFRKR